MSWNHDGSNKVAIHQMQWKIEIKRIYVKINGNFKFILDALICKIAMICNGIDKHFHFRKLLDKVANFLHLFTTGT